MVFDWLRKRMGRELTRVDRTWEDLKRDAGIMPIFNVDDTEARRLEIKTALDKILEQGTITQEHMENIVDKVYTLFFISGDPWYRGLDDEDLAQKVAYFLDNYRDVRHIKSLVPYLFQEAMFLLNLSWKETDVTVTPPYIVNKPVIMQGPAPRIGLPPEGGKKGAEETEE